MFDNSTKNTNDTLNRKLAEETRYHNKVRTLHTQTTRHILKLQNQQLVSHGKAVANMTKSLQKLVVSTTEMVGFMIGTLISGGEISGKNLFANFLDMLGQFSIMLGTVAVAASQVFQSLFTGNPAGLLIGGIAMIAVGGILKAFASQLKSSGSSLGSGSSVSGSVSLGNGVGTGTNSFNSTSNESNENSQQVVYYYHFEGGLYDEKGLARIATKAINNNAGKTSPKISRFAVENT